VEALPRLVNPDTGCVHATLHQVVAATGRLSSSDPNLQNIPIRTALGRQIRQAFVPRENRQQATLLPDGSSTAPSPLTPLPPPRGERGRGEGSWQLLTADYSQIELRMLAHFSDDPELRRAFAEDQDIHSFVASQIYGVRQTDVTPEMRRNAKTVNFGVIYGLSPFGLAARLGIGQEVAEAFIDAYFVKYRGVDAFIRQVLERASRDGCVTTILGRRRRIAGVRPNPGRSLNQSEREAVNTVLQGSAADLIKVAMINLYRRVTREQLQLRMLLQIHDELLFEVPNDELVAMAGTVSDEMTGAMKLKVPLKVDVAAGPNWLDVESVEVGGDRHEVGQ
jgi:DNA polymerase-1